MSLFSQLIQNRRFGGSGCELAMSSWSGFPLLIYRNIGDDKKILKNTHREKKKTTYKSLFAFKSNNLTDLGFRIVFVFINNKLNLKFNQLSSKGLKSNSKLI